MAVTECLRVVIKKQREGAALPGVVILTDCRALVQAFGGSRSEGVGEVVLLADYLLKKEGVQTVVQWIPSHVGVLSNEIADGLGNEGNMETTNSVRRKEWLSSTPKHILLYEALGWTPPVFGHLPLIVNPDGTKLSKRQGDVNIDHYKTQGYFPQAVINYITSIGGGFDQDTLGMTLEQMEKSFDVSRIRTNPGRLDPIWLTEANRQLLREQAWSASSGHQVRLAGQVRDLVIAQFGHRFECSELQDQVLSDDYILAIVRWSLQDDRTSVISDFVKPELDYLWVPPSQSALSQLVKVDKSAESILEAFLDWLEKRQVEASFETDLIGQLRGFIKDQRLESKKFFQLARLALTGSQQGAPLAETLSIIGRDNVLVRLRTAVDFLKGYNPH
ncbi:glutamate--tRNA ligase [Plakobranchus ocellatus]|uniref:Glutamate--tRNA ligase n=1 Tax=Plakobranchus ocellatus TaxID=259542 RepID=A0AAV3YWT4_9GAST|nr:glutamate--tRNA ligase [Plakobranchus ocellatus]